MKPAGWLLSFAILVAAPVAQGATCLQSNVDGAVAEGRLSLGEFEDAAGRKERAFILTLPDMACLSGPDEMDNLKDVKTIHVFSVDDALSSKLRESVGKDVRVRGNPFPSHTAHHHAPIVMGISEIDPL